MRYQDLIYILAFIFTSANNLNLPTLLTLFYFSTLLYLLASSSVVAVFIAKAGHVWVS